MTMRLAPQAPSGKLAAGPEGESCLWPCRDGTTEFEVPHLAWLPLWRLCCQLAADLIDPKLARAGAYNDGARVTATVCATLADRLEKAAADGTLVGFALQETMQEHSERDGEEAMNTLMRAFGGDKPKNYPPGEDTIREFMAFLRYCGGFEIW